MHQAKRTKHIKTHKVNTLFNALLASFDNHCSPTITTRCRNSCYSPATPAYANVISVSHACIVAILISPNASLHVTELCLI